MTFHYIRRRKKNFSFLFVNTSSSRSSNHDVKAVKKYWLGIVDKLPIFCDVIYYFLWWVATSSWRKHFTNTTCWELKKYTFKSNLYFTASQCVLDGIFFNAMKCVLPWVVFWKCMRKWDVSMYLYIKYIFGY